jgi:hypothetical protein
MDEIFRSNARVGRVCDWTLIGVAVVSVLASAPLLWAWTGSVPLGLGLPSALIVAAVAVAVLVQRRAVRRHEALCDARSCPTRPAGPVGFPGGVTMEQAARDWEANLPALREALGMRTMREFEEGAREGIRRWNEQWPTGWILGGADRGHRDEEG